MLDRKTGADFCEVRGPDTEHWASAGPAGRRYYVVSRPLFAGKPGRALQAYTPILNLLGLSRAFTAP